MVKEYDLIVVGSGPGGYIAAIRAAQLGKSVVVIEQGELGGACLNVGCIPSKTFLKHAEWMLTLAEAKRYGIDTTVNGIDMAALVARKRDVVGTLRRGIAHLFNAHAIELIQGTASYVPDQGLTVDGRTLSARHTLLATGSRPFIPPIAGLDRVSYYTTDTLFDLAELPARLVIIGGGVIAIELAFAMAPLGVEVTLVEVAPDILLTEESEAREVVRGALKRLGVSIHTGVSIQRVTPHSIVLSEGQIEFEALLVATGRVPHLTLAQEMGLALDAQQRFVKVDDGFQTSVPGVLAIGDLIGGLMLAHAASAEGIVAVDRLFASHQPPLRLHLVPRCVYSFPEIASVGLNEQQARERYDDIIIKKQPFAANGKAISAGETDGFVKLIVSARYGEIVGAVVVGAHATETLQVIQSTMQAEGIVDDLAEQVFAHPTLSEVIGETAKSIVFKAIHE